jgi:hypothetical protein
VCQRLILAGERPGLLDAHRDDGKRFVVRADEKLTAFIEMEWAIRGRNHVATRAKSSAATSWIA